MKTINITSADDPENEGMTRTAIASHGFESSMEIIFHLISAAGSHLQEIFRSIDEETEDANHAAQIKEGILQNLTGLLASNIDCHIIGRITDGEFASISNKETQH